MSTPKLYAHATATTSRAVLALIEAAGLEVELIPVDLQTGAHHEPEFAALNPNRLIPVLVDEGFVLTESSAILRYLASKASSPLYPTELKARARVDEMLAWFEANLYKDYGFALVYPTVFPHHSRGSEVADAATRAFGERRSRERLAVLDGWLEHRPWIAGDALTIADFHGASILSLGELIAFSLDEFPNVAGWYRRVTALDAWSAINGAFSGWVAAMTGAGQVSSSAVESRVSA